MKKMIVSMVLLLFLVSVASALDLKPVTHKGHGQDQIMKRFIVVKKVVR